MVLEAWLGPGRRRAANAAIGPEALGIPAACHPSSPHLMTSEADSDAVVFDRIVVKSRGVEPFSGGVSPA